MVQQVKDLVLLLQQLRLLLRGLYPWPRKFHKKEKKKKKAFPWWRSKNKSN